MTSNDFPVDEQDKFHSLMELILLKWGQNRRYPHPDNTGKELRLNNLFVSIQQSGFTVSATTSESEPPLVTKTLTYKEEENGEALIICTVAFSGDYRPPLKDSRKFWNKADVTREDLFDMWQKV